MAEVNTDHKAAMAKHFPWSGDHGYNPETDEVVIRGGHPEDMEALYAAWRESDPNFASREAEEIRLRPLLERAFEEAVAARNRVAGRIAEGLIDDLNATVALDALRDVATSFEGADLGSESAMVALAKQYANLADFLETSVGWAEFLKTRTLPDPDGLLAQHIRKVRAQNLRRGWGLPDELAAALTLRSLRGSEWIEPAGDGWRIDVPHVPISGIGPTQEAAYAACLAEMREYAVGWRGGWKDWPAHHHNEGLVQMIEWSTDEELLLWLGHGRLRVEVVLDGAIDE